MAKFSKKQQILGLLRAIADMKKFEEDVLKPFEKQDREFMERNRPIFERIRQWNLRNQKFMEMEKPPSGSDSSADSEPEAEN